MPDWGMWDMKLTRNTQNSGIVIKNKHGNWWNEGQPCMDCNIVLSSGNTDYNAGTNGGSAGSVQRYLPMKLRYCAEDYHQRARNRNYKNEARRKKAHLLNTAPANEVLEFMFPETKESVITQRTVNHKTRNHALATKLKELYKYTCQVDDCNETEVEIAHIYKHSLPDSVDDETNAWCLCCNHHRAYDANRMIFNPALDGRFIRYNRFGKVVEIGRIIYDEKHVIDVKWIKKSRDFHDSKK